jgi:hypothetical protein
MHQHVAPQLLGFAFLRNDTPRVVNQFSTLSLWPEPVPVVVVVPDVAGGTLFSFAFWK